MEEKGLIITAIILIIASVITLSFLISNIAVTAEVPEVDLTGLATTEEVLLIVSSAVEVLSVEDNVSDNALAFDGEYILTKAEFEDEAIEAEALKLATEYIESKDFKTAVFEAIEANGSNIDSYKDITEIKILDVDVTKIAKLSKVEFDVKVFYFIEDDEDEAYKTRFDDIVIRVKDLDFDDDFEDAEVVEVKASKLTVRYIREL